MIARVVSPEVTGRWSKPILLRVFFVLVESIRQSQGRPHLAHVSGVQKVNFPWRKEPLQVQHADIVLPVLRLPPGAAVLMIALLTVQQAKQDYQACAHNVQPASIKVLQEANYVQSVLPTPAARQELISVIVSLDDLGLQVVHASHVPRAPIKMLQGLRPAHCALLEHIRMSKEPRACRHVKCAELENLPQNREMDWQQTASIVSLGNGPRFRGQVFAQIVL